VLGDGEPPLGDDTDENHHDGEPPEFLFCCRSERYVLFFLLDAERGDDCEVAERTSEQANLGEFFYHRPGEHGGL